MFIGHRSNDAVITICQNNEKQSIEIRDVNKVAEEATGFAPPEIVGQPLGKFLPDRIVQLIKEYVEFEDDANDVGSVLSKVQSFALIDKQGRELSFKLKVVRSESLDRNAYFKLILQDMMGIRRNEAFRAILQENFKGHEVIDADTGLPDRYSIDKDLELVLYYVNKSELKACFALLEIDGFDDLMGRYGKPNCTGIVKHVAAIAKQNLRGDDTLGIISPPQVGILLIDTNVESARMVLNRLRWLIAANPLTLDDKSQVSITVSIGFSGIGGRVNDRNLLSDCETYMTAIRGKGTNALVEIGEVDKRQRGEDRRKTSMSVSFDRRKGPRRTIENTPV